jgi:hypothetical protein
MFNVINKIILEIKFRIPREVLLEAFIGNSWRAYRQQVDLDQLIINDVLRRRVFMDMNLVGGTMANIDLSDSNATMLDDNTMLYEIPPSKTSNREIVSVMSANFIPYDSGYGAYSGVATNGVMANGLDVMSIGAKIFNSHASVMTVASTDVELAGPFAVVIKNARSHRGFYTMRVILAYDEALSQINPRSYPDVSKLCEYACKSYIYNTLIVRLDEGKLHFGHQLGAIKEIVDSYADAEENYQTYLKETMGKVLFMNDRESYKRFIRLQINPVT